MSLTATTEYTGTYKMAFELPDIHSDGLVGFAVTSPLQRLSGKQSSFLWKTVSRHVPDHRWPIEQQVNFSLSDF